MHFHNSNIHDYVQHIISSVICILGVVHVVHSFKGALKMLLNKNLKQSVFFCFGHCPWNTSLVIHSMQNTLQVWFNVDIVVKPKKCKFVWSGSTPVMCVKYSCCFFQFIKNINELQMSRYRTCLTEIHRKCAEKSQKVLYLSNWTA